jgi:DNA-binding IscR family transcriptional regulator
MEFFQCGASATASRRWGARDRRALHYCKVTAREVNAAAAVKFACRQAPERFGRIRDGPDHFCSHGGSSDPLTSPRSCNTISFMRRDSRLSGVLHVLLHMAQKDGPVTSEVLARAMDTNPVVLRRVMAGLRDQGYVRSEKGHGGGWTLACDLTKVTLRDVYIALGSPTVLAIGNRTETPGCVVEQAVNDAVGKALDAAEALLLDGLGEVTLAALGEDVRTRVALRGACRGGSKHG